MLCAKRQHRKNLTGPQHLKTSTGIMFVLRKKTTKSYSNSQKRHSPATMHICTTQAEKSPISPQRLLLRASCQGPSLNRLLMKTLQSISCLGGERMLERENSELYGKRRKMLTFSNGLCTSVFNPLTES